MTLFHIPSTPVEDDEDEDEDNEDDSNDPEWRIDDDRDSETGKKKMKTSDEECEPLGSGSSSVGGGSKKGSAKFQQHARKGRKCRDKTTTPHPNNKNRKKNALGIKLSNRR